MTYPDSPRPYASSDAAARPTAARVLMRHRRTRRAVLAALLGLALSGCSMVGTTHDSPVRKALSVSVGTVAVSQQQTSVLGPGVASGAQAALARLPVKGRAPKTGYKRTQFGPAWTDANGDVWGGNSLETREDILSRDLTDITCKTRSRTVPPCVVAAGVLRDPYTGSTIHFVRGPKTSTKVQVDHVVSLSDSWQKGAQQLSPSERVNLANDPLNLIATDGAVNQAKRDSDAASWLMPNKAFRCTYVARQIAVKIRYRLWATYAERDAMARVLSRCPTQPLPTAAVAVQRTVIP